MSFGQIKGAASIRVESEVVSDSFLWLPLGPMLSVKPQT